MYQQTCIRCRFWLQMKTNLYNPSLSLPNVNLKEKQLVSIQLNYNAFELKLLVWKHMHNWTHWNLKHNRVWRGFLICVLLQITELWNVSGGQWRLTFIHSCDFFLSGSLFQQDSIHCFYIQCTGANTSLIGVFVLIIWSFYETIIISK